MINLKKTMARQIVGQNSLKFEIIEKMNNLASLAQYKQKYGPICKEIDEYYEKHIENQEEKNEKNEKAKSVASKHSHSIQQLNNMIQSDINLDDTKLVSTREQNKNPLQTMDEGKDA